MSSDALEEVLREVKAIKEYMETKEKRSVELGC